MRNAVIPFFIAHSFLALPVLGAPQDPIPEIVVTADPLGDVDRHLAAPVTVLDSRALRSESMRSIGEAVGNQLGVSSSDFGASVGRPVIRGLGGGRVRVLEDGIGAMDVSSISADHGVAIEPIFADQIEIFRGPATLLYGSGASGGLVNISNGRILSVVRPGVTGDLQAQYDSAADAWLGAFKLDAGVHENLTLHLDGLERRTDDLAIPGFAETTPAAGARPGRLANSDIETENFSGGASLVAAGGFLGFNVSDFSNNYGVPAAGDEAGVRIDQQQTRYDIEAAHDLDFSLLDSIRVRWGINDYEHDEIEPDGEVGTHFTNDEWEGRVELVHRRIGPWQGVAGIQLSDRDFAAVGEEAFIAPATVRSAAGFLFEKAHVGPVHLDAGLRFETQDADSDALGASPDHALLSVSGGAAYACRPGCLIGIYATRSERAPTIEELFAGGPHLATQTFELGDTALSEETSFNADIYWRKTSGRYRFDFTFFYNHIDDFIYLATNDRNGDGVADRVEEDFLDGGGIVAGDGLLLVNQAQQDADFRGFELAGEMTLFEDARGLLDLRLWSDYVNAELADGNKVPRLPPLRFGAELDWERGPLYARFAATRVTAVDDPAPLDTATAGYTMINVDAGYSVKFEQGRSVTLFARGSNLADDAARRHTSFVKDLAPLPGISAMVGIRAHF